MSKEKILMHLAADTVLKPIISSTDIDLPEHSEIYPYLGKCIIYQQLSVSSADSIYNKFLNLFGNKFPNPETLLQADLEFLRTAGVSRQKGNYLLNIAAFFNQSENHLNWKTMSDTEIIEQLTAIKGVGIWTAQMVLMFALCREDVFPLGDLGIQQAMESLYSISYADKKQLFSMMEEFAEPWRPYRSIACIYLWRYKDG